MLRAATIAVSRPGAALFSTSAAARSMAAAIEITPGLTKQVSLLRILTEPEIRKRASFR